jgi:uncharacterized repeat protein (TIGR01451 family)
VLGSPYGTITNGLLLSTNGVYRSPDAGQTWNRVLGPWESISNQLGRIEMAIAPTDPNVVYVSVSTYFVIQGLSASGGTLAGIWRTDNAWAANPTWVRLPDPGNGPFGYWYYHQLAVHPANASILYLGEEALHRYSNGSWFMLAGNWSGTSFSTIYGAQHAIAWAGNRLLVGNDGGVFSSLNDGATWVNHNTDLSTAQFYHGSLHPMNPNFALGGVDDGGTTKWSGGAAWNFSGLLGYGCESAFSSRNPDTHWAVSQQNSFIWRTLNGSTFTDASAGIDKANALFITRFARHPANDDLFLHGTDRLWKCTNFFSGTPAWRLNSPRLLYPVTTNVPYPVNTNMLPDRISAATFAASDATGDTYAYGTEWGAVRLTTDGGGNWIDLDPSDSLPDRYITGMAFDPNNPNVLWITMSGYYEAAPLQPGHVFKTMNALAATPTWSNVSPPANTPHNTIVIDPLDSNLVYVGTDIGVWKTTDGGANWTHMGPETGMPNVAVFELELNEATDRLVAFTSGRGAFALQNANTNAASLRLAQTVSQNPVAPGCDLTYTLNVRNLGPQTATGVVFSNSLPVGAAFISATSSHGSCAQTAGLLICNLGALPALSNVVISIVVTPSADALHLTNTAGVTANEPENTPRNNRSTAVTDVGIGINVLPAFQAVGAGGNATFRAVGNACGGATFQWRFNGVALSGATNDTLLITNVQLRHEGSYSVRLANALGSAISADATLVVLVNPLITVAPVSQSVVAGGRATFSVGFTGNPMPFGVEWRQGSIPKISNTVSRFQDFFILTNAQPSQAGQWRVIVRNLASANANQTFTLTVLPDSDGDGLPDHWETIHAGDATSLAPGGDLDGDGATNAQEYQAGTNPTNASSYLKVESVSVGDNGAAVRLTFFAASNNTYTVESRAAADAGAWSRVTDVIAASSNRIVEVFDSSVPGTQRYYRLATPRVP